MTHVIASRYVLGDLLGAGGMAKVVRGQDIRLDRPVAIKLVPADAIDPVGRERFRREARSSAGFAHHNAVTAYDAGESDGYLYLVMELVDGQSLAHLLHTRGQLSLDEALSIADSVLAALGAAHAAGIIHRDVKPGNVLLAENGTVKLGDFGIARRLDDLTSDLTGTGRFIGTPKYLAPEQLAGEPATAPTDLYAAGVVLYEMLAGTPPFDAPTPMAVAMAHQHAPVPDVRTMRPDVPAHVAAAIATAMAKDAAARFATADAMRRALRQPVAPAVVLPATAVLAGAPAVVGQAARTAVAGRPSSARRWAWLAALVALLVVAGVAVALRRNDGAADPSSVTSTSAVPGTTPTGVVPPTSPSAVSETTVAPTTPPTTTPPTTPPTTTVAPTTAGSPVTTAPPAQPTTVGELVDLIDLGGPDRYGQRTGELLDELERIESGNGNEANRASQLLDDAATWVDDGELASGVLPVLRDLIGPLAASAGNSGQGGGDGDDGDD
ncbi:MAG: serine/threonine-protein kinase [Ilumatobacteraceae bacterium]